MQTLVSQLDTKIKQLGDGEVLIQPVEGQGYRLLEVSQKESIRIVIDEDKFQKQVKEIVDSDFFQNLQIAAQNARRAKSADRNAP